MEVNEGASGNGLDCLFSQVTLGNAVQFLNNVRWHPCRRTWNS